MGGEGGAKRGRWARSAAEVHAVKWSHLAIGFGALVVLTGVLAACAGPAGSQGLAGPQGIAGATGPQGLQGLQGLTGPQGSKGDAGPTGPQGIQGPTGPAGAPASTVNIDTAITSKFTTADTTLPLWAVQPGTAPRMLELAQHFNIMWFAAQARNWDVVTFENYRVEETIKANVVTRPKRKDALEDWSKPTVEAIGKAAKDKDLNAFIQAYDSAITGCNFCHKAQGGGPLKTMSAYKITRPAAPAFTNIDLTP